MSSGETHQTRKVLAHLFWFAVYLGAVAIVHDSTKYFVDSDTGYHLAVARLISRLGILHAFPWTPFSWLAEHYADKELLFHILLVPLSKLPPADAARIAGTILGAGILASVYWVLHREQVAYPGWWGLLTLVLSMAFVFRIALVRPHLISISLAILTVWSAASKRHALLAGICFVFPLAYTAWHLPVILVALVGALRYHLDREIDWWAPAVCLAGVALGNLVHPNFPENLRLFWIQNYVILVKSAWGAMPQLDMGGEFKPLDLTSFLVYLGAPILLLMAAGGTMWTSWRSGRDPGPGLRSSLSSKTTRSAACCRRSDVRRQQPAPVSERWKLLSLAYLATAILFLIMTIRTQRFVEYFVPFTVVATAVIFSHAHHRRHVRDLLIVLFAASAVNGGTLSKSALGGLKRRFDLFPAEVARQVEQTIPPQSQIVTCDWRFTGEMLLALPDRKFVVALDPVFFALNDPARYRIWFDLVRSPPEHPANVLRDTFDADFVMCSKSMEWLPFLRALDDDPEARLRQNVGEWIIFEIRDDWAKTTRR